MPYLDKKDPPGDGAGWTALGQELGRIAKQVRGKGMRLAYHNHDFELARLRRQDRLELLFAAAGPDLQTELDLAWVARAGLDPAVMLAKFRGHVFAVHAKDNAPKGQAQTKADSPRWARACWTGTRSCCCGSRRRALVHHRARPATRSGQDHPDRCGLSA